LWNICVVKTVGTDRLGVSAFSAKCEAVAKTQLARRLLRELADRRCPL
jgi:hypothetical protein